MLQNQKATSFTVFYFYRPSDWKITTRTLYCHCLLVSLYASLHAAADLTRRAGALTDQKSWIVFLLWLSSSQHSESPLLPGLLCSTAVENWSQCWRYTVHAYSHLSSSSRTSHSAKLIWQKRKIHVLSAFVTLGMHSECSRPNHYSSVRRRSWRQWLGKKEASKAALLAGKLQGTKAAFSTAGVQPPLWLWMGQKKTFWSLRGEQRSTSSLGGTEKGLFSRQISSRNRPLRNAALCNARSSYKKLCRKKKVILTAQRLTEMQRGKARLPPLQKAACCSQAQLRYALPCAASEMRHFCHHHSDAEKLSLPTNWQRISVLIIILPCTSAWSTSQKQD